MYLNIIKVLCDRQHHTKWGKSWNHFL
jgi:hypothetical protein